MARVGRSTPATFAAAARSAVSHIVKQAWKASGFKVSKTRRKTSFLGMPCGRSSSFNKNSHFILAHSAMAVGPLAPASTAMIAMTITLSSGCSRFTADRGSSNCLKCRTISFTSTRTQLAIAHLRFRFGTKPQRRWCTTLHAKAQSLAYVA